MLAWFEWWGCDGGACYVPFFPYLAVCLFAAFYGHTNFISAVIFVHTFYSSTWNIQEYHRLYSTSSSSIIRRAIKIACTSTVCQSQNVPYDNDALDSRFYVRIGTGLVFRMCSFCPLFTIKIALSTVCVRRVSWFHVVALPIDKSRGDEKFYDQKQTHHLKYSFCSKDLVVRMYSRIHQSRGKTNSTTRKRHDT